LNWSYSISGDIAWPARFPDLSVPAVFGDTLKLVYNWCVCKQMWHV